ncbi:MAG: GtrA family protein [Planctomycetia bacterium]|nr:GtrA family protein [Planctomycetia bacterium]
MQEVMVQVLLFALVGCSSALVNLGIYNLALWSLQVWDLFPGFDFLIAQFFGFIISVAWAFFFNRRYVFRAPGAPWKESLIKVYITYSLTGIGLSSLLSLLWVHIFHLPKEIVTILNDTACFPVNFLLNKYWSFRKD